MPILINITKCVLLTSILKVSPIMLSIQCPCNHAQLILSIHWNVLLINEKNLNEKNDHQINICSFCWFILPILLFICYKWLCLIIIFIFFFMHVHCNLILLECSSMVNPNKKVEKKLIFLTWFIKPRRILLRRCFLHFIL